MSENIYSTLKRQLHVHAPCQCSSFPPKTTTWAHVCVDGVALLQNSFNLKKERIFKSRSNNGKLVPSVALSQVMVKHFVISSTFDVLYGCLQQKTKVCQCSFSLTCLSALRPVSKPFMSPSEQAQTIALLCVRHVQPWFAIHAFLSSTVVFTRLSILHPLKTARADPTMAPSTFV